MAWPPLLRRIAGDTGETAPAILTGLALRASERACFPQLQAAQQQVTGLALMNPPAEAADRIAYFATGLSYEAAIVSVEIDGRPQSVTVFCPSVENSEFNLPWAADAWRERWGQQTLFAADEIGQHYGVLPPDMLAQIMTMVLVRAAARVAAHPGPPKEVRSDLSAERVEIQDQTNRHAGFFLTREYMLRHPHFAGGMSPPVRREVFVATDAAIVLPYDPLRDRVLLVEQFRMGPFGRGDPHPWMLEPVAGRIDPGENPEETAHRECVEEAGLALDRLEHITSHYCSPGCSTEYFHCYLGLCDLPDDSAGNGGLDSEDGDIRTHVLPFERAMSLIPSGEASNGPLILCLMWLQRERERLRASA